MAVRNLVVSVPAGGAPAGGAAPLPWPRPGSVTPLSFRHCWNFWKLALAADEPPAAAVPVDVALLELPQAASAAEAPRTASADKGVARRDMAGSEPHEPKPRPSR